MSNFLFHNKFHRSNHHTVSSIEYPDSGIDPIASLNEPFRGAFYTYPVWNAGQLEVNVFNIVKFDSTPISTFIDNLSAVTFNSEFATITATAFTNTNQWYSTFTNIKTTSSSYNLFLPVYHNTRLLSSNWVSGYSSYTNLSPNSAYFESTYTTVSSKSAYWPFLATALRLQLSQENTRAKNFAGTNVSFNSNSAYWDLSSMQVGFAFVTGACVFKNIVPSVGKKKGGEYTLVIQQDGFGGRFVEFENDYVFAVPLSSQAVDTDTEIVSLTAYSVTVIRFICDGNKLFGKPTQYDYLRDVIWTYFSGAGITVDPNPAELYVNGYLEPAGGVTVAGVVVPLAGYTSGDGITILSGVP